jgi:hypothetical protein
MFSGITNVDTKKPRTILIYSLEQKPGTTTLKDILLMMPYL